MSVRVIMILLGIRLLKALERLIDWSLQQQALIPCTRWWTVEIDLVTANMDNFEFEVCKSWVLSLYLGVCTGS